MVRIRLQRHGRKKLPYYHIVAADGREARDGRIIEDLGRFSPTQEPAMVKIKTDRVVHWIKTGAQPSDTVRNLLKKEGIYYRLHLQRWGKSEEEIEKTLSEWQEDKGKGTELSKSDQKKARLKAEDEVQKKREEEARKAAEKKAAEQAEAKEKEAKEAAEAEKAKEEAAAAEEKSAAEASKANAKPAGDVSTADEGVAAKDKKEPVPTEEQEKMAEGKAAEKVENVTKAKAASEKVVTEEAAAKEEKQKEAKAKKPTEEKPAEKKAAKGEASEGEDKGAKAADKKTEDKK
ncbi:MAG: 30S ribosomal protein S16 [Balneolales bacterium]